MPRVAELAGQLAPWQVLERLRRDTGADLCRAAVSLHAARQAAVEKFGDLAEAIYADGAGVQMASAAAVAAHRAARFGVGEPVADLACGIGGDCLALAARGPVAAADLDPARAWMTRRNAELAGVGAQVVVARADAAAPASRCAAVFADPARRDEGGRRVRRGSDYAPSLAQVLALRPGLTTLAVKVSPALDEAQIPPTTDEVEYVSWRGQCREAVLWYGAAAGARRRASVLGAGELTWNEERPPDVAVGTPGAFLYDPDPAVVRSHLVGLLARQLGAALVGEQVAYLTTAARQPTKLARCFRVLDRVAYGRRRLQQRLAADGWRPTEILRRRFPVAPEALMRDLRGGAETGAHPVTLLCTRVDERPVVFICEPC